MIGRRYKVDPNRPRRDFIWTEQESFDVQRAMARSGSNPLEVPVEKRLEFVITMGPNIEFTLANIELAMEVLRDDHI